MFSKMSVKRPYTVLVAVVLVIVLGVVSLQNMKTDLLPKMDFPYAIIMTTYQGASPEQVEGTVTKPVEQAMARVSNIKNITSTSKDNMSMVMLEFNQGANMDSETIEIRESLDTISSYWDDSIGKPVIMKVNPEMMPIMVAGVNYDNLSSVEVTNKVDKQVVPELESIEGVASVNESGQVTEQVEVLIRQEKLDAINQKVQDAINGKLKKAQDKISSGKEKLESGKNTLTSQQNSVASKIAKGETKVNTASTKLADALKQINSQITEVKAQQTKLSKSQATAKAQLSAVKTAKSQLTKLQSTLLSVEKQIATNLSTELTQQKTILQNSINSILNKFSYHDVASAISALTTQETALQAGLSQMTTAQNQINAGLKKLTSAKTKIEKGQVSATTALEEINKQKILASIKLSVAEAGINSGKSELDKAESQFNTTKKETAKNANLHNIITSEMVKGILTAENFQMPAGYITEDNVDYLVRVGDKMDSTQKIENLVIADMGIDGLDPIKLSDIADVVRTNNSGDVYTKLNGKPAVAVVMQKQAGYSTGEVANRILDKFDSLQKSQKDLHITTLMNQGVYIDMVVGSVKENLIMGGILAIIILLLFLKDLRPTFIVACSIPFSLLTAIVLMYFSGVTLNIISLSGLALGVGMLVDNSVVVIENIYRLRREGYSAGKAAIEGAKEMAGAITASTLTTVCVFAPIIFTEGITRQLFVDLGLTLTYSLLASLIVALTLVPALSASMLRKTKEGKPGFIEKVQDAYGNLLAKILHRRAIVLIGSVVLLGVFIWLATLNGTAFMPEMESTQISATIKTDKDKTSKQTMAIADNVIEKMRKIDGVETVGAMSGEASFINMSSGDARVNSVSCYVLMKENSGISNEEMKEKMEECTKGTDCTMEVQTSSMDMSALGGKGISVQVKGKDLDKLQTITKQIMDRLKTVKGLKEISNGMEDGTAEYRVNIDREKAMKYTLTVAQVFSQINAKVKEQTKTTTITTDTKDYDVVVKNEKDENITRDQLKDMMIDYTVKDGSKKKIKLSEIADFSGGTSPNAIQRDAQTRQMTVTADLEDGYNIGIVSGKVKEALKDYKAPSGYEYTMKGEDETINDSMKQLGLMFLLGVIFMYLIMVAQFQSLLSPFIVMFTIPLAFTGGFMGLFFTGSEISVIAMLGLIMLSGIIVNNGIVLVDYANQLRRKGMEKKAALVEAGRTRLRPILMTALTTILGLSTMAMGLGMGGEMVQPMAIVVIGGLTYGTLLTLFVVPCIYDLLNRKEDITEKEI